MTGSPGQVVLTTNMPQPSGPSTAGYGPIRRVLLLPSSLRSKLLIVVLVALLPLLIFGIGTGFDRRRTVQAEATTEVMRLAQVAADHYSRLFAAHRQDLALIASVASIADGGVEGCNGLLAQLVLRDATYLDLQVLSRDGLVQCDGRGGAPLQTTADREAFARATLQNAAFTVGDFGTPTKQGAPSLPIGYPIVDVNQRVQGLVFGSLDLRAMSDAFAGWPSAMQGMVVDPGGAPVWRFPSAGGGLAPLSVKRSAGEPVPLKVVDSDGKPQLTGIAAMAPSSGMTGFIIAVGVPVQGVLDDGNALLARNLAVLSMVGLLALIAAWRGADLLIRQKVLQLTYAAQSLRAGNLNARAQVSDDGGELDDLARTFNEMAEALQLEERMAVEMAQINKELEMAESMQVLLLPRLGISVDGLEIASVYRPCKQLGGDAYDVLQLASGTVAFVMADVSGHSVSSGLLMTAAHSVCRMLLEQPAATPALVLERLNAFFYDDLDRGGAFFSMFLAIMDRQTQTLTYASAGHNPPWVWRVKAGATVWLHPTGPLVGLMEKANYEEVTVQLAEGDTVLMYTDGVTEARNEPREMFGMKRLEEVAIENVNKGPAMLVNTLVGCVLEHSMSVLQDDATIMAIRLKQRSLVATVAV